MWQMYMSKVRKKGKKTSCLEVIYKMQWTWSQEYFTTCFQEMVFQSVTTLFKEKGSTLDASSVECEYADFALVA